MTVSPRSVPARLAAWSLRHHWAALVAWVLVVLVLAVVAGRVGSAFTDDTTLPGSESQRVADALGDRPDEVSVVVHRAAGALERDAVTGLLDRIGEVPGVAAVSAPRVSPDGRTALATVTLDSSDAVTGLLGQSLDGHQVEWSGDAVRAANESGGPAEGIGLLAALIILVPLFGSLLAATLPLVTALLAVGSAVSAVILLSHVLTVPSYATAMMALVGLGVGIDYALLVFVRYRHELRGGASRTEATERALDTAGRSVLLAGVTVILALLGMLTLRLAAFDALAVSVALTVLATMLASITLLPALLTLVGRRLERRLRRAAPPGPGSAAPTAEFVAPGAGFAAPAAGSVASVPGFGADALVGWRGAVPFGRGRTRPNGTASGARWRALAAGVQRAPIPALVGGVLVLLVLAAPALGMRLGFADAGTDAPGSTTRAAYDLIASAFGPGTNGPLLVVADEAAADEAAADEAAADEAAAEDAAAAVRSVRGWPRSRRSPAACWSPRSGARTTNAPPTSSTASATRSAPAARSAVPCPPRSTSPRPCRAACPGSSAPSSGSPH